MANLYSQYGSGTQFTAGTMTGSANGVSGLNPIVDRLNSISTADNFMAGSLISGTNINCFISGGIINTTPNGEYDIVNKQYLDDTVNIIDYSNQITFQGGPITTSAQDLGSILIVTSNSNDKVISFVSSAGSAYITNDNNLRTRLMRDATILYTANITSTNTGNTFPINYNYVDTPGIGSFFYKVTYLNSEGTGGAIISGLFTIMVI